MKTGGHTSEGLHKPKPLNWGFLLSCGNINQQILVEVDMALIVEDGSGVADADSYVSLADARMIAANYGYSLPVDDTAADVSIRQGTGYVDLNESCFPGERTHEGQSLAWPRTDAKTAYGSDIGDKDMPSQLKLAVVAAAAEYGAGSDIRASDNGEAVASKEVVGAVKKSFFNTGSSKAITITKAMDALKPLMIACKNNGFEFRVGRA